MLIGLAGLKQSGKSTIEKSLLKPPFNFTSYSFAHPIKLAIANLFNLGYHVLDSQSTKELPLTTPPFDCLNKPITPRLLMTTLGTQWGRDLVHQDLWTELAKKHIDLSKNTLISDVRFENEAKLIRELNGKLIHIRKADNLLTDITHLRFLRKILSFFKLIHQSEVGVKIQSNDILLYNDSTIVALYKTIELIISDIKSEEIIKNRTYYSSDYVIE